MITRRASVNDAGELARLHRLCFEDAWSEEFFRETMAEGGVIALVAGTAAETELQAFVLIRTVMEQSEILTIATLPEARRHGFARALLREGAAEAARKQVATMFLEVAEDNQAALALYRDLGFVLNGRRRHYYHRANGAVADALMLRADLPLGHGNDRPSRLDWPPGAGSLPT